MAEKILFVDDEPAVLDGYKRMLFRDFDIATAVGGVEGMQAIETGGPFAIVISDMRMPVMNGAKFLSLVRQKAPHSVRMLLTGYTDTKAAIDAVNEGNIFRFLTKPCEKELLSHSITAGLEHYRLVQGEKELLEKTLLGCIKVLTEVLGAASPEAFGRTMRITRYLRHLAQRLDAPLSWRLEAAASLSQLGCVTLPTDVILNAYVGGDLSTEDQARYDAHPAAACELLAHIPRLEPVAWMIRQQRVRVIPREVPDLPPELSALLVKEAHILKLAIAFDDYRMNSENNAQAIIQLHKQGEFSSRHIEMLGDLRTDDTEMEVRLISVYNLANGMILEQEIRDRQGVLKVTKGQEITSTLRIKLGNLALSDLIANEVLALVPIGDER